MAKDADWALPAMVLLLAQHASAMAISYLNAFSGRPPTLSYILIALVLSTLGGVALLLRKIWMLWRDDEEHPLARLKVETDPMAVGTYFLGFQLVALQIAALTWLKEMLPLAVPYWADSILANVDRGILGTDAWRIVPDFLVAPLDGLYPTWAVVKFVTLLMVLILPASRLKAQAMLGYFLTVGLVGVSGQYLLSSAGPIFYDRVVHANEFTELASRTKGMAPIAHAASEYLWQSYLARDAAIGAGISAMPSMHVATTTWSAIALSRFWPKSTVPIWAFWLIIMAGSIALGWHYLSDSLVGVAGAILCWKLAPILMTLFNRLRRSAVLVLSTIRA